MFLKVNKDQEYKKLQAKTNKFKGNRDESYQGRFGFLIAKKVTSFHFSLTH